jgi:hypothetical protein
MDPIDILRRLYLEAEQGPSSCVGFNADGKMAWKSGFLNLLWEAHNTAGPRQEVPPEMRGD